MRTQTKLLSIATVVSIAEDECRQLEYNLANVLLFGTCTHTPFWLLKDFAPHSKAQRVDLNICTCMYRSSV